MPNHALSPQAPVTIPIRFVRGLLSGLPDAWPPLSGVLAEVGIAEALLQHGGARVSADQYAALFRALCDRLDDECIGLLSRPFKRGSYALMAHAALSAQDLQMAIQRTVTTFRVLQDDMTIELVSDKRLAGFALHFMDPAVGRHAFLHEFMLRSLWRLFDWLVGGDLAVSRFDFAFAFAASADDASASEFFKGPTAFGQPFSAVWFDRARLSSPVRVNESALLGFLTDPQTKFIVPARGKNELSDKVLGHLHQSRPAWPDLEATALALCMSATSLQRNLAREGSSFQALKDRLRRDMAITYLNSTAMSLTELADKLGFSERASFQRAFKAWTGIAPGSYRRDADKAQ